MSNHHHYDSPHRRGRKKHRHSCSHCSHGNCSHCSSHNAKRVHGRSNTKRIHPPITQDVFSKLVIAKKLCKDRIYYVRDEHEICHYYALNECEFYWINERMLPTYQQCEW